MAQSSNYKQYARTTRVLTEESSFAGGMLWTGNNIDETHLKTIVNCDYDDTTSYLKARAPFVSIGESPTRNNFKSEDIDLRNWHLLSVQHICAFDKAEGADDALLNTGKLYIFSRTARTTTECVCHMNQDNIKFIYYVDDTYYTCQLIPQIKNPESEESDTVVLHNTVASNLLINYENQLYGLGSSSNYADSWLNVYRVERHTDGEQYYYYIRQLDYTDEIKPKMDSVSLLEACVSGFNAARGKDTFTYSSIDTLANGETPYILGVYITDLEGNVLVSPHAGQTIKLHVPTAYVKSTSGTKSYLALFQLKEGGETTTTDLETQWSHVATSAVTNGEFVFNFKLQKKKTTLGFTYYGTTQPSESNPAAYSDSAVDYLMPYQIVANDNLSNLKVKNYDLTTTNGSCIWKNRMCVWGTQSSHNSLFLSEVDNFFYYPIPNNVALFDSNIISCIPYKDTLLVFTASKIYRLSENNDGTFSQTVVQNDMPLTQTDAAHLTAIKNMVLFKSGDYFYMIVPKSQSLTDELSVAPIYKNIAGFLNSLDKSVQEVLQLLYPEYLFKSCTATLYNSPTAVYAEQDTIHILYDVVADINLKTDSKIKSELRSFKMFLNYNTNLRAWTIYFEDTTDASLEIAYLTASRLMTFVRVYSDNLPELDRIAFDIVAQQHVDEPLSNFRLLVDTGYRTLSTSIQKRFREIQLKLYNASECVTAFGTAFLVDGVWRRNYSTLQETMLDTNKISLMPTLDLNTFVTELTMPVDETGTIVKNPGSDAIELSSWTLDFSHFKREAPTTVRIPVSGKGFNPRFILMAPNAAGLTINEINWVYRLMHGR